MAHQGNSKVESAQRTESAAELTLAGFRLLRPHQSQVRDLVAALVAPAFRLHRLKDTRTRLWHEALRNVACGARKETNPSCSEEVGYGGTAT